MMLKRNCIILSIFLFSFAFLFFSCKTKEVKKEESLVTKMQKTYVIQVCDKFQLSYNGLPAIIYFSDGTTSEDKTAVDGKITVTVFEGVEIEKIVYNFSHYKQGMGQLLASLDFKVAKKISSHPSGGKITIRGPFSSEVKNLFILRKTER